MPDRMAARRPRAGEQRVSRGWVLLALVLLVGPALAGCLGGSDEALDPSATDGADGVPTLPEGLEMEGAEVVEYNETTVVWEWSTVLPPGASATSLGFVGGEATTTFDVPDGVAYGLHVRVEWEAETLPQLILDVDDSEGDQVCRKFGTLVHESFIACAAPLAEPLPSGPLTVAVQNAANANAEAQITATVTLSTGTSEAMPAAVEPPTVGSHAAHSVVAFTDTGITPYHEEFRDDSPEAYAHPSTYIDGYPEDARALELTLDAPGMAEGLGADAAAWAQVEPETLYWIPGTRIVGAILPDASFFDSQPAYACSVPALDCHEHGTAVASRGAGNTLGTCPDCKIVAVQGFHEGLAWASEQSWIDVTSNSWWFFESYLDQRAEIAEMVAQKPSFTIATNGVRNLGVVGTPATVYPHQGTPDAIVVGGHDNGRVTAWPGSVPNIVSDLCVHSAVHTAVKGSIPVCATSISTPGAAGTGAQMLLEARRILGDAGGSVDDGVLARGDASAIDAGPLSDGSFTVDEFRDVLYATAQERPRNQDADSPTCDPSSGRPVCLLTPTIPVEWQTIPEGVPQYYFIGYGAVNGDTLEHAKGVLRGEEPMPERPVEDAVFALDQEVRKALVEVDP